MGEAEAEAEAESEDTEADDGEFVGFDFRLLMLVVALALALVFDCSRALRIEVGSSLILLTDNKDDCWECMKGDIGADGGAELGG